MDPNVKDIRKLIRLAASEKFDGKNKELRDRKRANNRTGAMKTYVNSSVQTGAAKSSCDGLKCYFVIKTID